MPIYTKLPPHLAEVDVIIAGGGACGCIIASRLSDADPNLTVLLIESGINNVGLPVIDHVGFWFGHIAPGAPYTNFFTGAKSEHLDSRQATVPVGHILGGGTSINSVVYSRPQRSDYDAWKAEGWSADEILPYMKKFESYNGPGPKEAHGYDGPVQVSPPKFSNKKLTDDFLGGLAKLGWPEIEDINCFGPTNGAMRVMRYQDSQGRRQDTPHTYLHPRLSDGKHPNLHLLLESQVERVLVENNKAVGVTYRPNPAYQPGEVAEATNVVKARKMVVMTAGALSSPLILQRSGIGNADILNKAGVPLVADIPGVGASYEDHNSMMYTYRASLCPEETLDRVNSGRIDPSELIASGHGSLTWNSIDVQAKIRPSDADVAQLGSEFQAAWDKHFKTVPDKPLMVLSPAATFPGPAPSSPQEQYFTLVGFSLYPFSRGHMYITGPKIDDAPDFDAGVLSDPQGLDLKNHVWMFKTARNVARHMSLVEGRVPEMFPVFPPGSKAQYTESEGPDSPPIEYSAEDDAVIEQWIRQHVDSTWHPIGTCRMAPLDDMGVVKPNLDVHGIGSLKIADMSICPSNIGANPCNTAMTIGEKAADILIEEMELAKH